MLIPAALAANCSDERTRSWLDGLPSLLEDVSSRWELEVGDPFDTADVTASWVAPCVRADGTPAVVKLPIPHFEADHEADGLRFWNGSPTVLLLEADDETGALLLERCLPGTTLRALPEPERDVVIARLLREIWREPPAHARFRPLAMMIREWTAEIRADEDAWTDPPLTTAGLEMYDELLATSTDPVLLATDLHAGNVLRAERQPWLVIDAMPFVGDRAYDVTQHLVNCAGRMTESPLETIARVSDLAEVDAERARGWMFARAAAELRGWSDVDWLGVARRIAP